MHFLKIHFLRCNNAVGCVKKRHAPRCIHKMQAILSVLMYNHRYSFAVYPIRNLSSWQRREWLEFIGRLSISVEGHHRLIFCFRIIFDYFQCRKCRFPDVGPRRKCQGFCALKSSEFRLKRALRNSLSMYFH